MKKLETLLFAFLFIGITSEATPKNSAVSEFINYNSYNGKAYIFEEGGIEFSVFADGQFDFAFVGQNFIEQVYSNDNSTNVNISFNAGHDYDMFIQYDDYGAVTQVENVPIYYDNYGRITQAGNINIRYINQRIVRVGGLHIYYNHYGNYVSSTGFINAYNQFYVYRPWHRYYVAPIYSNCIVYDYPYRRYYAPIRYSYVQHRNYYYNRNRAAYRNARRNFNRPGSRIHYKNGRTARNANYNANRKNTMISETRRGENASLERTFTRNKEVARNRNRFATNDNPSSTIGMVNSSIPSTIIKGRPSTSHSSIERGNPITTNKGKPEMSYTKTTKRRTSTRYKSIDQTAINSNRYKTSTTRDRNTESRGNSSKRRGGL